MFRYYTIASKMWSFNIFVQCIIHVSCFFSNPTPSLINIMMLNDASQVWIVCTFIFVLFLVYKICTLLHSIHNYQLSPQRKDVQKLIMHNFWSKPAPVHFVCLLVCCFYFFLQVYEVVRELCSFQMVKNNTSALFFRFSLDMNFKKK